MTTEEQIRQAIYELLHPTIEIVSLDNPIPTYAHPGDACVDLRACVDRTDTTFWRNAYVESLGDYLHDELGKAMEANDWDKVNKIWNQIDAAHDDGTFDNPYRIVMNPNSHCVVPTGLFLSMPEDYVFKPVPRSGLALKKQITLTNSPGMIDSGYRDEIGVILDNEGTETFYIYRGDRIAQGEFALKCTPTFEVKQSPKDLSGNNRGGGFGHSGIK